VTQRLTVFSEDASVSKKIILFSSAGNPVLSVNGAKTTFSVNKKKRTRKIRFLKI
jgi:hypothetical protein